MMQVGVVQDGESGTRREIRPDERMGRRVAHLVDDQIELTAMVAPEKLMSRLHAHVTRRGRIVISACCRHAAAIDELVAAGEAVYPRRLGELLDQAVALADSPASGPVGPPVQIR